MRLSVFCLEWLKFKYDRKSAPRLTSVNDIELHTSRSACIRLAQTEHNITLPLKQ